MLNQFRAQKLEWNRANNQIYDRVEANSGDSNGRTLFVQISNDGMVEDLTGATLSLAWSKRAEQGLEAFEEVDAKKGEFRLFYPTGMLVNRGVLRASLVLVDVTGRIESKPFDIIVHKGTVDDEAVESDNKFTALTTALVKVSQVQAEFDSLYGEKSQMMDTLHDDKKADMEALEADYSNRANTLEATYAPRLTEVSAQLAQKANEQEMQVSLSKKRDKATPISLDDADSEFIAAIQNKAGETTFNLLSEPRDYSVTPRKTTFLVTSSNLFNKETSIDIHTIDGSTGELTMNSKYVTSDFIDVDGDSNYSGNYVRWATYDKDKNFISSEVTSDYFVTETNARYVRIVFLKANLDNAQLNKGSVMLPYEEYYTPMIEPEIMQKSLNIKSGDIPLKSITVEHTDFFKISTNILNEKKLLENHTIDRDNGQPIPNALFSVTEFILVDGGEDYTFDVSGTTETPDTTRIAYYDKNKIYVDQYAVATGEPVTVLIPENISYIRAVVKKDRLGEAQINKGTELLPYEPFYIKFDEIIEGEQLLNIKNDDYYVEYLEKLFTSPALESVSASSGNWILDKTYTNIYGLYDALQVKYPNYIIKTLLGTESTGKEIYRYDFKPPIPDVSSVDNKFPKMLLIGATHGSEKAGAWVLYQSLKQICERWETEPLLESLRWNVHLVVIPVLNPYGWENQQRQNANGVDLARNFPTDWELKEVGTQTYGGEEPLSEIESQFVYNIMTTENDLIYVCDFHNYSELDENLIWNAGASRFNVNIGKKLISSISRKWAKEYTFLPKETFFGYSDDKSPIGSIGTEAVNLGIHGSTFEVTRKIPLEPTSQDYSANVITFGVDAFINWLLLIMKNNVRFYNSY